MDVAVIGCGSAGPAAAALLARAGHAVTLFEEVAELGAVGAGLMLQPTGLDVLARLGALETIADRGAVIERLRVVTSGGATLMNLRYGELGRGLRGVGIHRAVLLAALVDAARDAGVAIELGVAIERVDVDGDRAHLVEAGGERGPYDLVVAADGARSQLREAAPIDASATPYPWGALWFIGEDAEIGGSGELLQVVRGARRMVGLLPTGHLLGGDAPLVSLFWSVEIAAVDRLRDAGLAALRDEIAALAPRAKPLLEQIESIDDMTLAGYLDVRMRRWSDGPLVFIGDAAHATSPQLGQGVNLGLCDAAALADALAERGDVAAALAAYRRARLRHVRYYQWASRWLTPFFQSSSRVLGLARDVGFRAARHVGPLRRRMTRTMAGVDRGVVRRPLPMPDVKLLRS